MSELERQADVEEAELDRLLRIGKPIYTNDQIRDIVRGALDHWQATQPLQVAAAMEYIRTRKEAAEGNKTHRTGEGEHILGAFPQVLANVLAAALNDANWMHTNPRAIGIVFDEFQVGRFAHWEGRGQGGAGSRVTLNSADKD